MLQLRIDEVVFVDAFIRDLDFEPHAESVYLDRRTGDIHWIADSDSDADEALGITSEDNRQLRNEIKSSPQNYLLVPGMSHAERHAVHVEFRDANEATMNLPQFVGSIGKFNRAGGEEVKHAFQDFQYAEGKRRALEYLREHDIDTNWQQS